MLYQITGAPDPFTFEAPDVEIAFGVTVLIGSGRYAMKALDPGGIDVPPLLLDGSSIAWCRAALGASPTVVTSRLINERRAELVAALDSLCIGDRSDRAALAQHLAGLPAPDRSFARGQWHDARRGRQSCADDIGRTAWGIAAGLDRQGEEEAA